MEDKIKYEKHWLKLLVEGDEKAYKRLFELYYSSLVMFAAKYLRDTDLAEDLVQDVIYDFSETEAASFGTFFFEILVVYISEKPVYQLSGT